MVGDILNMRHPLTGGGMTVAIKDVELFANSLLPLGDLGVPGEVTEGRLERAIAKFYEGRGRHASTINILANALHRVFTKPQNDDGTRGRLRAACLEYLSMGGPYSAGPVGLLSGLTPAPWVLVAHFFAVAAYAMRKALLPPTPTRLRQGYDLMHVACIIIMPLLASERATVLSWTPVQWGIHLLFPWKGAKL
jgi:squalene monooxygenase